jgi:hypothetical protein
MSYFGAATDMNSMPQQAVTKGYWNSENLRAQLRRRRACRDELDAHGYSHPTARLRQT